MTTMGLGIGQWASKYFDRRLLCSPLIFKVDRHRSLQNRDGSYIPICYKSRYTFRDPPSAERSLFIFKYILLISSVSVIINWIIFERICTMYNICTSFLDLNNEVKYLSRGPLLHILHCWQISVKTSAKYLHLQSKGFNGTMARS